LTLRQKLEYYTAMRTTIELKEEHRALLHALAARRGWRGYSKVVEEAIEFYLAHHEEAEEARRSLLLRKGAWTAEEAARTRAAIAALRTLSSAQDSNTPQQLA
jgi:metal-responsive CopG/Arc/MetJ family transcriptional regulator